MNRPSVVSILGNSVALLVQPLRESAEDRTYPEHLRDHGFTVVNASKQSAMLPHLYRYLEDECIRHAPDFVVVNFGIVECTSRVRSFAIQRYFSMNAWNNSVIDRGYVGPVGRGVAYMAKKFYSNLIERALFSLGWKRRWVSPNDFRFVLRDVLKRLFADTPVRRIVILGMLRPDDWLEREAPGTRASVEEYNGIMRSVAAEYVNLIYVDPEAVLTGTARKQWTPDGMHFTGEGHRRIAEALSSHFTGEREDYTGWTKINQYGALHGVYARWNKRATPRDG
jgi:hypothetical protein